MPKLNISLCIAAVMFCLTLFSTYFVSGLYARYTTTSQVGGSARVAVFSVKGGEALTKPIVAELVPGEIEEKILIITNNSEVAVDYKIEVKNKTENLPLRFAVTEEGGTVPSDESMTPHEFTCEYSAAAGKGDSTYKLYIDWYSDDADVDLENIGRVDQITVTVTATQAD